ncbi:hypothetical protein GGR42_002672 [Saonia flava]|uniref:WG containing repeat-containing protein n=1 Tax=Saonia flava TaxID=523696 RepID=A0A846QV84_9FLAO|nr:WG repeat-containing protein [Saonia flava]NJB72181.1 hypothetical protein [Saonia flava]
MKTKLFIVLLILSIPVTMVSAQTIGEIDEIAPFSEGLAAVRQDNSWGFVNEEGALVIDYRDDLHWNKDAKSTDKGINAIKYPLFKNGLCMIKRMVENIPHYGFINSKGEQVIEPKFLNVSSFENGYTTGIIYEKVFKGNNEFNLKIYDYKFHEVLMDSSGEIVEFLSRRDHIQMVRKRYEVPEIRSKMISKNLIAIQSSDKSWEIKKLVL